MFRKHLKIVKLKCECWAKKIFFKLIYLDEVEKVLLDIPTHSVIIYSKRNMTLDTIRQELNDTTVFELNKL
ncbi:hypothetical protein CF160_11225 [Enterococcus pseudoavium]|nr:hypothetical protein CF160_11225 [Enterococcus pseudoavium]